MGAFGLRFPEVPLGSNGTHSRAKCAVGIALDPGRVSDLGNVFGARRSRGTMGTGAAGAGGGLI